MKLIQLQLFTFDELTSEAKSVAIEDYQDINVQYVWWDSITDDAKNVGLEITSFSIEDNEISGDFLSNPLKTANLIKENHSGNSKTYLCAECYLKGLFEDDAQFRRSLLKCYLERLENEFTYLTSFNGIRETLIANDYYFLSSGKRFIEQ